MQSSFRYQNMASYKMNPYILLPFDLLMKTSTAIPGNDYLLYPMKIRKNGQNREIQVGITSQLDFLERVGDPMAMSHGIQLADYIGCAVFGEPLDLRIINSLNELSPLFYGYYTENCLKFVSSMFIDRVENKIQGVYTNWIITRAIQREQTKRIKEAEIRAMAYSQETFLIILNGLSIEEIDLLKKELLDGDHHNLNYHFIQFTDNIEFRPLVSSTSMVMSINENTNEE